MRTLTGITPSGTLHIGNYFGAMRPAIEAQASGDCYYFIADYHSMTSVTDPKERLENTRGHRGRLAGLRPRPGEERLLAPERRARGVRADVAHRQPDADGTPRARPQLQGQDGQGHLAQLRALRLPGPHGRGHPPLRHERRARRPGPAAAPGDDPRHRDQVQPDVRRDLCRAGGRHPRAMSRPCPASTAEDEQELRQHDRDIRGREGPPEKGHVDRHGQPHAGRAKARCRAKPLHPAPEAGRAGAPSPRTSRTACAPGASATATSRRRSSRTSGISSLRRARGGRSSSRIPATSTRCSTRAPSGRGRSPRSSSSAPARRPAWSNRRFGGQITVTGGASILVMAAMIRAAVLA